MNSVISDQNINCRNGEHFNPTNKKHFIAFIAEQWQKVTYVAKLSGKTLFVTTEDQKKVSQGSVITKADLRSTQEEADTRILLHAADAAKSGYKTILISSEDTDVFVLCLTFNSFIQASLYMKCGTQTRTRYIDISMAVQLHGPEVCKCLIGLHAYTGRDSVSAFAGKGKIRALKLVKRQKSFQDLFEQLGMQWEVSSELFERLQEFTCKLYSSNPGTSDVNELRYRLFCARKATLIRTNFHPVLIVCESTHFGQTTRQRSGKEACRAALKYLHLLDPAGVWRTANLLLIG